MDETKPWYLSKTVWAALSVVLLAALGALGLATEGLEAETGNLTELIVDLIVAVAGLVALFGRVTARAKLTAP